jgi:hypothetical protein
MMKGMERNKASAKFMSYWQLQTPYGTTNEAIVNAVIEIMAGRRRQ